jgi:AAHS family 4-hydroxybenzoate transporter-like MFS transporter
MTEAISGAVRAGGESRLRWITFGLCALTMFTEGYDAQFIGSVVPGSTGLAAEFGIAPGAMWPALSAGLVGLMLGAFFVAPLADSLGRRRLIIFSVGVFGVLTIASVFAGSLTEMAVYRFLTGLGLGGAMANTTALTAEFSPPERRAAAVAIMFCSFSLGAAFGGFISASLLETHGWESVFLFCGIMAVLLLPLLILFLPESLPAKPDGRVTIPAGKLFSDGRTRITILLWVIFFANLMELYIISSWLPTTIGEQLRASCPPSGAEVEACAQQAVRWANTATGLFQIGGIAGAFMLSPLVDRYGPKWVLPLSFLSAAVFIAALSVAGASVALSLVLGFLLGIGTVGAQNCNNGIAAKFYPTEIRATGIGWALAVGRSGSILGPAVGGLLLSTGFDIRAVFLVATIPPLVAAGAYLVMGNPKSLKGSHG